MFIRFLRSAHLIRVVRSVRPLRHCLAASGAFLALALGAYACGDSTDTHTLPTYIPVAAPATGLQDATPVFEGSTTDAPLDAPSPDAGSSDAGDAGLLHDAGDAGDAGAADAHLDAAANG